MSHVRCNLFWTSLFLSATAFLSPSARAQAPQNQSKSTTQTVAPAMSAPPWSGDFDGMLKRGYLRALVASSKSQYYVVNGVQHGSSYEFLKGFEDWINHKYPPKAKNIHFHIVFVPVSRDQLFPRLAAGRGDLAVGALTITPDRQKSVDFSDPLATGVKQIAVTGPNSPELRSLDDLSGQEVFARKSSSYWEHLEALNAKFQSNGKAPVKLRAAPEDLEDEDLLEMLNAGLVPIASPTRIYQKSGRRFTPTSRRIPTLWSTIPVKSPGPCAKTASN